MNRELHVFEEATNLFWGLIILVCTAIGTYLLAGSFINQRWNISQLDQLLALGLFLISFRGIFKISEPLYHFIFTFDKDELIIQIYKGEQKVDMRHITVKDIEALKFSPHSPRSSDEALFDFATNYLLMWKKRNEPRYQELLDMESANFTLKVDDIAKIMRFIRQRNTEITIPSEQEEFFRL